MCVCFCVCVCGQWVSAAAASAGVWRAEGSDHGAVLLHDALCGLLHDVPPDQRTVCHQTLHHLQHAGGKALFIRSHLVFGAELTACILKHGWIHPSSTFLNYEEIIDLAINVRLFVWFSLNPLWFDIMSDLLLWTVMWLSLIRPIINGKKMQMRCDLTNKRTTQDPNILNKL